MADPAPLPAPAGVRELAAAKDWAATPLGPVETWSIELRTMIATCLGARVAAVVFWGPDLVQIYNDAYAPLIGAKHPSAFGQRSQDVLPEIWHVIGPMLRHVLESGVATWEQDQQLYLDRAGFAEECYFTYTFSPIGADPIVGVFCVAMETTAQVVGERRAALLRELSANLAGLSSAEAVFDGAVAVLGRHSGDIRAGHLRVVGDDDAPVRSWPVTDAVPPAALDRLVLDSVSAGGRVVENAAVPGAPYRLGDPVVVAQPIARLGMPGPAAVLVMELNRHVPFDIAGAEFIDRIGDTIGAAYAVADGFEAAARRTQALEDLDAAKTAFLSNISHEFRTPLTLLLGPLAAAQDDARLPGDLRDGLLMAERNGRRVLKLVNSLLDISRLEAGRVAATFQPTDLGAMTTDLASIFRGAADGAGIGWHVDCGPLDEAVYVDREMWEQIVTNLCANALKFTEAGTVTVRLSRAGADARLDVVDTGVGIAAADRPYIFDRFRRGENPYSAAQAGSGLGLALVRELVDRHGGQVAVDSRVGHGSTFTVTIPFGTAHLDPAHVAPGRTVAPRSLSASPADIVDDLEVRGPADTTSWTRSTWAPGEPGSATIWIVDDDADMREYLDRLLRPYWRPVPFPNAEAVVAALAHDLPDLILSDVMLPGASGLDLLAAVRDHPTSAGVPVILLSARAGEEATVEGLRAGADDYMVKPFTARELVSRVRSNLHLAGMRREVGARALRHALQLEALAGVATQIISADTLADIATAVEDFVRDMTGAASCAVTLESDPAPAGAPVAEPPAGRGRMRVPLEADDGSVLGRIDLTVPAGGVFDGEDVKLVEQLAVVAGRRIENLRSFSREQGISHLLQRSLLPERLPLLPGIDLVARYRPAVAAVDVGGDWYDALVLPDGRLMVTVGDVMGHDLAAAVTMSQIRLLLRARAADSPSPAALCATVNRLLPIVGTAKLASMIIAFIDVASGHATLVNAGHPAPVLRTATGTRQLAVPVSMPVGVVADARYSDFDIVIPPESLLLMYTDGLVERRTEDPWTSRDKLLRRIAELDPGDLDKAVDALLDAGADGAADDIALLALRRLRRPVARDAAGRYVSRSAPSPAR